MGETCYHLDRYDDLEAGETIELDEVEGLPVDGATALRELFPEGLSHHGRHYGRQDLYEEDPDDLWDFACEVVFELQRRARYPERPSRFQSVFGFETLDAVERFADGFVDDPRTVWEVEADSTFVADMHLVDAEDLADGLRRADLYWRGATCSDDPLWEALLVPPIQIREAVGTRP